MNCRDNESLILAERDGAVSPAQLAGLSDHVATCPACAKLRANLAAAFSAYQAGIDAVPAPPADEAWREFQDRIRQPARREKRPLAPLVWFGAPLAAAAALAFALIANRPASPAPAPAVAANLASASAPRAPFDDSVIAGADYVEAGDPNASTLIYVDKESGWLVVWAASADTGKSG
jgi:anti-sigma factor RsiW